MMTVAVKQGEEFLDTISIQAALARGGTDLAPTNGNGAGLMPIIQPRVRDRWLGLARRNYTPQDVKTTLEGTNFGHRLYFLMCMFEMLEETWPRVAKNLHEVKTTVARLEWIVQPWSKKGMKPTAKAQAKASFVEDALFRMRANPVTGNAGLVDMLYHLMDAFGKGVSVQEIDWGRSTSAESAGAWVPFGSRYIRPCYYDYPPEPEQRERLMLSPSGNPNQQADLIDFPPNKFLVGGYAWRSAAILGRISLLRTLAPWWIYTSFATEWLMAFGQIFGMPIRIAKYATTRDLPVVSAMLEQMGAVSWAAMPTGTDVELHEASKSAGDNPNAYLINYCDTLADVTILGQSLTSSQGSSGSRALGEVHERILSGRVKASACWAGETLTNQVSRSLINVNWGDDEEIPVIIPKIDDKIDPLPSAQAAKILFVDMGLPVTKDYLYNNYQIPQPEDGDDLFEPPAPPPVAGAGGFGKPGAKPMPGARKPGASRALAALEGLDIPDEVVAALERLPEAAQDAYVEELVQGAHFKGGQRGGGRFMPKAVADATQRVKAVLATFPSEGQHRARRNIKTFGLPDNYTEFAAYNSPGLADRVDTLARRVKRPTKVKISDLKTTQSGIDGEKVMGMLSTATPSTALVQQMPIVVKRSNKLWLWDGHHRAVAAKMMNQDEMDVRMVDTDEDN